LGGGGNGNSSGNADPGKANTGGGAGGKRLLGYSSANGGSGIVCVKYSGSLAKATGGDIFYISGSVIHVFRSSGNFITN